MRKLVRAGALVFAAALVVPVFTGGALAQDDTSGAADEKLVFNVGVDSDITSLNPFNLCCGPDYEYLELIYDLGFSFTRQNLSPAPRIITSWEPSEDSMTWTLKIRDDATFHDGEPLTAEDVAFTFQFVVDNAMPFYKDYFPFNPTFEVVDDTTVLWKAEEPTFAPEVPAYMPILPQHIWEQFSEGSNDPKEVKTAAKEFKNDPPIGSGPFVFEEWKKGQFLRVSANRDYWGGPPAAIDEVVLRVYDSKEAMAQAVRSGEIDYAWSLSPNLFNTLKGEPGITTRAADGGCWGNIAYNFGGQGSQETHHPAIDDLAVRQAVAHAVDRQQIIDKVYQGTAVTGDSILMPGKNGFWYEDIPAELEYPYDPARASQILDDAGYADTDADGIREMPDGSNPLIWEFMTITDVDGSVDTGKLFQDFLEEIGIGVEFTTVNTNKAYDLWYTGEWDVYVWDWCPDPDPDFMLSVFTTDQCLGWSDGCYSNPEYDALYKAQQGALDRNERRDIIVEMQETIARELPVMVLNYWSDLSAYRSDRWTGFEPWPNSDAGVLLFGYGSVNNYLIARPVSATSAQASQPGLPGWAWGAIVAGIVVIGAGIFLARRRGGGADEEV